MIDKLTGALQNLILLTAIGGSLIGGLYFWLKDKWKDVRHEKEKRAIEKDNRIANEPNKRGNRLIDDL